MSSCSYATLYNKPQLQSLTLQTHAHNHGSVFFYRAGRSVSWALPLRSTGQEKPQSYYGHILHLAVKCIIINPEWAKDLSGPPSGFDVTTEVPFATSEWSKKKKKNYRAYTNDDEKGLLLRKGVVVQSTEMGNVPCACICTLTKVKKLMPGFVLLQKLHNSLTSHADLPYPY